MLQHSQNFLVDPYLVKKLIEELSIQPNDLVIDIGAGEGIITKYVADILSETGKVIAVELDQQLVNTLDIKFSDNNKVEVLHQDILTYEYPNKPFKVVANIPFNITSEILNRLLNPNTQLSQANLILQEEAALMYGGRQIGNEESFKSLLYYPFFNFKTLYRFHRSDFIPEPKINILFLQINRRSEPLLSLDQWEQYRDFLSYIGGDRVGDGVWKKIFSKKQMTILSKETGLVIGKGIKTQRPEAIIGTFSSFNKYISTDKRNLIRDAYKKKIDLESKISKINRTRTDSEWLQK